MRCAIDSPMLPLRKDLSVSSTRCHGAIPNVIGSQFWLTEVGGKDVVLWIDLLEGIVIHLWNVLAEHAQFLERLGLVGTSCEVRFKLPFERTSVGD